MSDSGFGAGAAAGAQAGAAVNGVSLGGGAAGGVVGGGFFGQLQPAAWNGVPFFVEAGDHRAGRNTAIHPYPYRERSPVWVEDLGVAPLAVRVIGFLIGDDVIGQQAAMLDAVQQPGPGELVHPYLGSLIGSIVGGCSFRIRKDRGRYIEVAFEFVESDDRALYPATQDDTRAGVQLAVPTALSAAAADYQRSTGSPTPSALAQPSLGALY